MGESDPIRSMVHRLLTYVVPIRSTSHGTCHVDPRTTLFGYWSHDIGGFEGTPDPAVFKRWLAFGLLSSHSRLHGSSSYRVPWAFDDEAVEVTRIFTRLKLSLVPYLSELRRIAHQEGLPIMRRMIMEFPDDRGVTTSRTSTCWGIDPGRAGVLGQRGCRLLPAGRDLDAPADR